MYNSISKISRNVTCNACRVVNCTNRDLGFANAMHNEFDGLCTTKGSLAWFNMWFIIEVSLHSHRRVSQGIGTGSKYQGRVGGTVLAVANIISSQCLVKPCICVKL